MSSPGSMLSSDARPLTNRLRWTMVVAIVFGAANALIGQPGSFWSDPGTAIRGDGLSIHSPTNHAFEFFLGYGWQAYVVTVVIYTFATFALVSILPRGASLIAVFAFTFAHYYNGANWLAVRWHLGVQGPTPYAAALSAMIGLSAPLSVDASKRAVTRLRWIMFAPVLVDFAVTLIGQPASYWHNPQTAHESNELARVFLTHGWAAYLLYGSIYSSAVFFFVSELPQKLGLICAFTVILGGFTGFSNWFFYQWRLGAAVPALCGIALSALIVVFAFRHDGPPPHQAPCLTASKRKAYVPTAITTDRNRFLNRC